MTNEELKQLEKLYYEERDRRIKINALLEDDRVKNFLMQSGNEKLLSHSCSLEPDSIFREILQNKKEMKVTGTKDIYFVDQLIEDYKGLKKYYANLESYDSSEDVVVQADEIENFENNHYVIDSTNRHFTDDGCRVAQSLFFLESFENGQDEAKRRILENYGTERK